jgi:predicted MFS family arabinose efflux permease
VNQQAESFSELTSAQKKTGLAAWLGWCFDGLEMHLFTLVALPLMASLMHVPMNSAEATQKVGIAQAAFLLGWAVGGLVFGRLADVIGRKRALNLTILTYSCFTGLSFFATEWWHLAAFRFLAALGIGGEWAVGASLIAETWPKKWGPWLAAGLQIGVNIGILLAALSGKLLAGQPHHYVFLIGLLPALLTLWIRKSVPETEEWSAEHQKQKSPGLSELFTPELRRTTITCLIVCGLGMTAHWSFNFWNVQHLRAVAESAGWDATQRDHAAATALLIINIAAMIGNFVAAAIAFRIGYRRAIAVLLVYYFAMMWIAYGQVRGPDSLLRWFWLLGMCQGVFCLFNMYLPALYPTLVRATGAGFCFNFGRILAAGGALVFVFVAKVGTGSTAIADHRIALLWAATLFVPAAIVAWFMPEEKK